MDSHLVVASSHNDATLPLKSVFSPSRVDIVHGRLGRSSIVSQLVEMMVRSGVLRRTDGEQVIQAILKEERFGTTALGRGLATPHLMTAAVATHVGAAMACPDGVDFGSLDKAPTRLIVLLLSPVGTREEHAELLSRVASLMHDKRLAYVTGREQSSDDLYTLLADL